MYETTMTMVGRLVDWPQRWDFDGGGLKATFRLARTERRFDRDQRDWVDGASLFLTVSCRRVVAERVLATLKKGDPVIVRGRLQTREWEKDGRRHSVTELEATAVGPDLAWCSVAVMRRPVEGRLASAARPETATAVETGAAEPDRGEPPWPDGPPPDDPWTAPVPQVGEQAEAAVG